MGSKKETTAPLSTGSKFRHGDKVVFLAISAEQISIYIDNGFLPKIPKNT